MIYGVVSERRWVTVLSVLVVYAIREDTALGVAFFGLFLLVTGWRPRVGFILAATASVWFVLVRFVIMPLAGPWFFANLYKHVKNVCRRQTKALNITPSSKHPMFADDSFMLAVLPVRGDAQDRIPACSHMGTGRLQIVEENANPRYYRLIEQFGDEVLLITRPSLASSASWTRTSTSRSTAC